MSMETERAWICAFEEPTCADFQAVLPCWQARGVGRKACVASERAVNYLAADFKGRASRAETNGSAEF